MEQEKTKDAGLYNRFFNESDTAMAVLSSEGFILIANQKFEKLVESLNAFNEENGISVNRGDHPRSIEDILNPWQTSLFWSSLMPLISGKQNQVVFESPFHFRNEGDAVSHWFKVHAWWIEEALPDSQTLLIGLNLEDYTLVRQEEKKLLQEKEIAEKAMEAKSQFLANMSHEIRTPIQTVIGITELLEDTTLNREQSEYSRQIKFSADVLLSLINDILDFSKIEAGKMELEHIDFDLEQIVEQAVEMIAMEAHKKGLSIVTAIPLETNIIIKGDPNRFRQIVINLAKNAVKFTNEGGVVVSTALSRVDEKETLRVSVADTGIGIKEETRARLFSTFMQADVSNTRRFGGTGLGLAISHNLVELMKGRIEMVPNAEGGSIFRFDIPLERSEKKPEPLPPPGEDGRLKILIADDSAIERDIITSCLADLGYTNITRTESGESALELLRAEAARGNPYRICLIDMTMPIMDGWRLAAEIHNDNKIHATDLILMVPHGLMGPDTKMTLLKWFRAYINKPVKRRSLGETINQILNEPLELEEAEDTPYLPDAANTAGFKEQKEHTEDIPVTSENIRTESGRPAALVPRKNDQKKLPVLIAEDHPVNQKLFSMIMDKLGYASILADDGEDALEKAAANDLSLIFMDIQMPRMNGYEATENLRKRGFKKPIIAVTASALSDERERCLKAGIDDILVKPFKRDDLEKMLRKWTGSSGSREPGKRETAGAFPKDTKPKSEGAPAKTGVPGREAVAFNAAYMLDTFMNDEEIALPLLSRFIERTQTQLEVIPALEKNENWENARREAHTIKGAALTMGGTELGKAAARLELAFKNIDRNEMEAAYPLLWEAFGRFKKAAEDFIYARGLIPGNPLARESPGG